MNDDFDPEEQDDEGDPLEFSIAIAEDRIVIDFGKPVFWFTLNVKEAEHLIELIKKRVDILNSEGMHYGTDTVQ